MKSFRRHACEGDPVFVVLVLVLAHRKVVSASANLAQGQHLLSISQGCDIHIWISLNRRCDCTWAKQMNNLPQ